MRKMFCAVNKSKSGALSVQENYCTCEEPLAGRFILYLEV
jgi:hypothetical protein